MSQQQSSKHGPATDEALQDERRQSSEGTRHKDRPDDDPIHQDEVVQDPPRADRDQGAGGPDPRDAPGDAAEEAGIVDQQAVAVQAVQEAEDRT